MSAILSIIIFLTIISLFSIISSFIYACVTSHTKVSVLAVVLLLFFGVVISVIIYLIRVENNAKAAELNEVKKAENKVETIDVDAEIQEVQKLLDKDMINEDESGLMVQEIMRRKVSEVKAKQDGNKVETIDVDAEIQEVQKLLDEDMINEEESGLMVQEIMKRKELEAKEKEEFNAIQAKEKEKEIEAKEKEIQAKEKEELLKEFETLDKLLEEKVITQKEYDNTKVNLLQQFVKAK